MQVNYQDHLHEVSHGWSLADTLHVRSTDSPRGEAPPFDESAVDEATLELLQPSKRPGRLAASDGYAVLLDGVREEQMIDAELDGPMLAGIVQTRAVFPNREECSPERVRRCRTMSDDVGVCCVRITNDFNMTWVVLRCLVRSSEACP